MMGDQIERTIELLKQRHEEHKKAGEYAPRTGVILGKFPFGDSLAKTRGEQMELWLTLDELDQLRVQASSLQMLMAPYLYGRICAPNAYIKLASESGILQVRKQAKGKKYSGPITKDQLPKNQLNDLQMLFAEMLVQIHSITAKLLENELYLMRQLRFMREMEDDFETSFGAAIKLIDPKICDMIINEANNDDMYPLVVETVKEIYEEFTVEKTYDRSKLGDHITMMIVMCVYHYTRCIGLCTGEGRDLFAELEEKKKETKGMLEFKERGNQMFLNADYEGAIEVYTKAIALFPYNGILYCNRCQAAIKMENYRLAISDGYRATTIDPICGKGYYRQAEAYRLTGNITLALRANDVGIKKCEDEQDLLDLNRQKKILESFDPELEALAKDRANQYKKRKRVKPKKKRDEDIGEVPPLLSDDSLSSFEDEECKIIAKKKEVPVFHLPATKSKPARPFNNTQKKRMERKYLKEKLIAKPKPLPAPEPLFKKEETPVVQKIKPVVKERKEVIKLSKTEQDDLDFNAYVTRASNALIARKFRNAITDYEAASKVLDESEKLTSEVTPTFRFTLGYARAVASLESSQACEVSRSVDLFRRIVDSQQFQHPMALYRLARAFFVLNKFEKSEPILDKCFAVVKNTKFGGFGGFLTWPKIETTIPESNLENLKSLMAELAEDLKHPPKPQAICRYINCLKENDRRAMYFTDLNFEGYLNTKCSWDCRTSFHFKCWNKFKLQHYRITSDKEILGLKCFTSGCRGIFVNNAMLNENGEVWREITWQGDCSASKEDKIMLEQSVQVKSDLNYKARLLKMKLAKERKKAAKAEKKAQLEEENKNSKTHTVKYVKEVSAKDLKNVKVLRKDSKENIDVSKLSKNKKIKRKRTISLNQFISQNKTTTQRSKKEGVYEKGALVFDEGELTKAELKLVQMLYDYFESVFKEYGPMEINSGDMRKAVADLPTEMQVLISDKYGNAMRFLEQRDKQFCRVEGFVGIASQLQQMKSFYQTKLPESEDYPKLETQKLKQNSLKSDTSEFQTCSKYLQSETTTPQTAHMAVQENPKTVPAQTVAVQKYTVAKQKTGITKQTHPIIVKKDPIIVKKDPITVKKDPITVKKDPIIVKKDPITVKKDPITVKKDPITVKKDPITSKKDPIIVKKDPITVKKDPITGKKGPIIVQKGSISVQKDPIPVQKKHITLQESRIFVQKDPNTVQKAPVPLKTDSPVQKGSIAVQKDPLPVQKNSIAVQRDPIPVQPSPECFEPSPAHLGANNIVLMAGQMATQEMLAASHFYAAETDQKYQVVGIDGRVFLKKSIATSQSPNMTPQSLDMTLQNSNMTLQNSNMTSQSQNMTSQNSNMTSRSLNMTSHGPNMTAQSLNMASQNSSMTSQSLNMRSQDSMMSHESSMTSQGSQDSIMTSQEFNHLLPRSQGSNMTSQESQDFKMTSQDDIMTSPVGNMMSSLIMRSTTPTSLYDSENEDFSHSFSQEENYEGDKEDNEEEQSNNGEKIRGEMGEVFSSISKNDSIAGGDQSAEILRSKMLKELSSQVNYDNDATVIQQREQIEKLTQENKKLAMDLESNKRFMESKLDESRSEVENLQQEILRCRSLNLQLNAAVQSAQRDVGSLLHEKNGWTASIKAARQKERESQDRASELTNQLAIEQNSNKEQSVVLQNLTSELNKYKLIQRTELNTANNNIQKMQDRAMVAELRTLETLEYHGVLKLTGARKECERFILDFDRYLLSSSPPPLLLREINQARQHWLSNAQQCALLVEQVKQTFQAHKNNVSNGLALKDVGSLLIPNPPNPAPNLQHILMMARRSQIDIPVAAMPPFSKENQTNNAFHSPMESVHSPGAFPKPIAQPKSVQAPIGSEKFNNGAIVNHGAPNNGAIINHSAPNNGAIVHNYAPNNANMVNNSINHGANNGDNGHNNNGNNGNHVKNNSPVENASKNNENNNVNDNAKNNVVQTNSHPASPAPNHAPASKPMGSFDRIMLQLQAVFTTVPRKELALCIKEVRSHNNNSLTGLSNEDIVKMAAYYVDRKGLLKKFPPQMTSSGSRPLTSPTSSNWASSRNRNCVSAEDDNCVICQEELKLKKTHKLLCNHVFHHDCLEKWLKENRTCPTCRDYAIDTAEYPALTR